MLTLNKQTCYFPIGCNSKRNSYDRVQEQLRYNKQIQNAY